jgi:hypothetical protein
MKTKTPDYMELMDRISALECALSDALEWAEMVAGSTDFNESATLQNCLNVLNGED